MPIVHFLRLTLATSAAVLLLGGASHAADNYDFLPSPAIDLNRIYRVDKTTGEVGACQYYLKEGSPVGVTKCYPSGQGAEAQGQSDYKLVSSRHEHEAGVWRIDLRTGMMSMCYVLDEVTVCTPPAK